jgi:hypothetical protein
MRKRLEFALMATPGIATLLSLTSCLEAATNTPINATTDDCGRKIYVNDASIARSRRREAKPGSLRHETFRSGQRSGLLEYNQTPVGGGAARQHAGGTVGGAEADHYLDRPLGFQNSPPLSGFSQKEIDKVINKARSCHSGDATGGVEREVRGVLYISNAD